MMIKRKKMEKWKEELWACQPFVGNGVENWDISFKTQNQFDINIVNGKSHFLCLKLA